MGGTLSKKQEKLLSLFKDAIESEEEAQRFYAETLLLCDDPSLKGIIESFISQEKEHEEKLIEMYNELREKGEFRDPARTG
jgi:rubrerythrin